MLTDVGKAEAALNAIFSDGLGQALGAHLFTIISFWPPRKVSEVSNLERNLPDFGLGHKENSHFALYGGSER